MTLCNVNAADRATLRCVIGVPLEWRGSIIGACIVFSRDETRTFGPVDAHLLQLFADVETGMTWADDGPGDQQQGSDSGASASSTTPFSGLSTARKTRGLSQPGQVFKFSW